MGGSGEGLSPPGGILERGLVQGLLCGLAEFEDTTNGHDVCKEPQFQFLSVYSKEARGNERNEQEQAKNHVDRGRMC